LMFLAGCGAEAPEAADEVAVVDGKADSSFLPAPGDTAPRLYFDNTQVTTLDSGPKYWLFTARSNHSFTVEERGLVAGSTDGATQSWDGGLFCQFESGCGMADQGGECAVQPTVCPRGIACFPVCGCDGKEYCMGCDISSHGQSVAHMGQCECDENQFEDSDAA